MVLDSLGSCIENECGGARIIIVSHYMYAIHLICIPSYYSIIVKDNKGKSRYPGRNKSKIISRFLAWITGSVMVMSSK